MRAWSIMNSRQRAKARKIESEKLLKKIQSCGSARECLGPALMFVMMELKYPRDCPKNSPSVLEVLGAQLLASKYPDASKFLAKNFYELGLVNEDEINALRAEMQKGENGNGK